MTDVVRHLAKCVNGVACRRGSLVLLRGKKAIAELRPAPSGMRLGDLAALLRSLPRLTERKAEASLMDVRRARQSLAREPEKDPWTS